MRRASTRRRFLRSSAQAAGAFAAAPALVRGSAVGRDDRVALALVGCGGRGSTLIRDFLARGDVDVLGLADADLRRATSLARDLGAKAGKDPLAVVDYRRLLDEKGLHAVVVATPDHWHAIPTIEACRAGKDVYVEKPASHNVREGRRMVDAARKHGRIVQVGLQNRSAPENLAALELIRRGELGSIPLCKVYNLKSGGPFRLPAQGPPPDGLDFDRWLGPAPARPFNPGIPGGWYYFFDYCGGDMGNDSIHQIDIARWLLGKDYPRSVHSSGGRLVYPDDRDVPDTQVVTFDFADSILSFELTQWAPYMDKIAGDVRQGDLFPYWPQCATRIELYGTKQLMVLGRHGGGWQVFTSGKSMSRPGQVVSQMYGRVPDVPHKEDFLHSVRTRKMPNADIEEGHRSAILAHLGNISTRLGGRKLAFDGVTETFVGDEEASRMLGREYRAPYLLPEA